jgi:ABC-2 type transport system permease protein
LWAVVYREWLIFTRYPSWIVALVIWPLIFPAAYILSARALAGPDGSGLALFTAAAGTTNYIAYIVIGTSVWMWQNVTLWTVGYALRSEHCAHAGDELLTPSRRFGFCWVRVDAGAVVRVSARVGLGSGCSWVRLQGSVWLVLLMFVAAVSRRLALGWRLPAW